MAINHALVYSPDEDTLIEYYYHITYLVRGRQNKQLRMKTFIENAWIHTFSAFLTIEEAVSDPNDEKEILLAEVKGGN